ncbi:MAG: glycosyltransferase N-terminal domain-containing protein [Methyloceanibacter sp.]|uniref:glycosyltransferase N-terminal domain-containing protein n=1 Tax=Methyloceanibacter sp. TaxID=1965321 RepID=UPI003D6D5054
MLKRLLASKPAVAVLSALAAAYVRLVYATSTVRREPADTDAKLFDQHPQILAMWHGQFLLLPHLKPKRPADVRAMVSRHGDAEVIGGVLKRFGMDLIRGAGAGKRRKNRGGATALRESVRALAAGATVAMTADVPPGPARRAGEGIATLAALSGRPVVPFAIATSRSVKLPTWSAFTINLPFSTLAIVIGDPVRVPAGDDAETVEAGRRAIERALAEVTARAYALAGATDPLTKEAASKPGFSLKAYRLGTRLAAPIAPLILAWRTRRGKEEADRHPERYGLANVPRPSGFLAWFHAASVGEVNAALPVIEAIATERPRIHILLTTATVTSARLARERLPKGAMHQYVPLDRQHYIKRFLKHWRPDLAVLVESEIWPNLVLETRALGIPLLLINGRMSADSFRAWRRRPGMSRPLFSAFDLVLAQNDTLAERFSQLGVHRARDVGNLKADAPPPPVDLANKRRLASALSGRRVWLAASTHPGEEEVVATAHSLMKRAMPDLLTIIVPRHPERGQQIAEQLKAEGLTATLRSQGVLPENGTDIYLADTIGELGLFYALAPVALVGGSLVPRGGQNPVEAIKLGAAVLTGPNWQNFGDAYTELLKARGAREVTDAETLAVAVLGLIQDETARNAMTKRAAEAVAAMGGALPRTLDALEPYLPPKATLQHAS